MSISFHSIRSIDARRRLFRDDRLTAMSYLEFKTCIQRHLEHQSSGVTWHELRETLKLPYERPCPEWTRRLEREIGLVRHKGRGRSLYWTLCSIPPLSPMFDHIGIFVSDPLRSIPFYEHCLAPLGITIVQ